MDIGKYRLTVKTHGPSLPGVLFPARPQSGLPAVSKLYSASHYLIVLAPAPKHSTLSSKDGYNLAWLIAWQYNSGTHHASRYQWQTALEVKATRAKVYSRQQCRRTSSNVVIRFLGSCYLLKKLFCFLCWRRLWDAAKLYGETKVSREVNNWLNKMFHTKAGKY